MQEDFYVIKTPWLCHFWTDTTRKKKADHQTMKISRVTLAVSSASTIKNEFDIFKASNFPNTQKLVGNFKVDNSFFFFCISF